MMHRILSFSFAAAVAASAMPARAGGTITGSVSFNGAAPTPVKLDRKGDAACAGDAFDESILVNSGALKNVVVRLKNAPAAPAPETPVVVNQNGCLYTPHVQAAMVGQKVEIQNGDLTLHNVHAYEGTKTLFNQAQPPKAAVLSKTLAADADIIKLKCDVHSWMVSYIVVSKSPFFATSGADGRFEIKDVPPGKYTVEAWHEKLGTKTAEITVEEGKTAELPVAFAFTAN